MPFNSAPVSLFAQALSSKTSSQYSYSRKCPDGYSAWQEHLRRSFETLGGAPMSHRDRDLRRAVVPG